MVNKYLNGDTIQGNKYRQEGILAQQYLELEARRKELKALSRSEMQPILKKRATFSEKLRGKKDEYTVRPHVIGMSGKDPLLGFATDAYVGGKVLKAAGQALKTVGKIVKKPKVKASVGDITPESYIQEWYPAYNKMKASPHYKAFDPPYFEENVSGNNITLLGLLDAGKFSEYQAERIINNMRKHGFDPDVVSGSLWHNGLRVVGKPSTLIREKAKEPINMYITKEPTTVTGFLVVGNGRAYARIKPGSNAEDIRSVTIHEGVSHGTDDVVRTATNGEAAEQYQALTNAVKKAGFNKHNSDLWYELRSTMAEFMRKMYNKHVKATPGSTYADVEEAVYKEIDNMPVNKMANGFKSLNAYGNDYHDYLMQNPFEVGKFKSLLKYGMGLVPFGVVQQEKKGGKVHKPFGHRSVLDNGWQSTKLLKNKKNVYGK